MRPSPNDVAQRFLHALLSEHFEAGRAQAAREARLARAFAGLDEAPPAATPRPRTASATHALRLAAAALLVGLFGWWTVGPGTGTASAAVVVEQALAAQRTPVDREYLITVERGRRHEASLFVRGGDRAVLCRERPPHGELWMGFNPQQSWLISPRPLMPVLVRDRADRPNGWLEQRDDDQPFLELTTALESLGERYELARLDADPLDGSVDPGCAYVRGTLSPNKGAGRSSATRPGRFRPGPPQRIELRARANTGLLERLQLTWTHGPRKGSTTFELVSEEPRTDAWYGHAAHHAPDRRIREARD